MVFACCTSDGRLFDKAGNVLSATCTSNRWANSQVQDDQLPTRLIESASHRWKHQSHQVSREGTFWCGQREVTTVEDAANSLGRRTIEFEGKAVHGKELGRSTERQQAPEHPQITNVASRYAKTSKGTRSTATTKVSQKLYADHHSRPSQRLYARSSVWRSPSIGISHHLWWKGLESRSFLAQLRLLMAHVVRQQPSHRSGACCSGNASWVLQSMS